MPYGPVRNLVWVIENAGAIVVQFPFGTDKLDAVSQWPQNLPPIFFVNSDIPADRWRFTLAHELGHIVMHRIPTPDAEKQADQFASEFLMPEKEILLDIKALTLPKAIQLKSKWRVSMQAIIRRAYQLGEITNRKYVSLFSYISKLGYRKREPNPISSESPTTLSRLLKAHREDLGYSEEEMLRLLFCDEDRFRSLYSAAEGSHIFNVIQ